MWPRVVSYRQIKDYAPARIGGTSPGCPPADWREASTAVSIGYPPFRPLLARVDQGKVVECKLPIARNDGEALGLSRREDEAVERVIVVRG